MILIAQIIIYGNIRKEVDTMKRITTILCVIIILAGLTACTGSEKPEGKYISPGTDTTIGSLYSSMEFSGDTVTLTSTGDMFDVRKTGDTYTATYSIVENDSGGEDLIIHLGGNDNITLQDFTCDSDEIRFAFGGGAWKRVR